MKQRRPLNEKTARGERAVQEIRDFSEKSFLRLIAVFCEYPFIIIRIENQEKHPVVRF
jgi:hypothetical protein